ncbi:MAG: hypothetical protein K0R15_2406 [Clostridiales bacterium]|jgi:hypothetical protein|nr:hypothetical protein [Clostridiales bacterium]
MKKENSLKKDIEIYVYSLILLLVLVVSTTIQLNDKRVLFDMGFDKYIFLLILNAVFIVQIYFLFLRNLNQLLLLKSLRMVKTIYIHKANMPLSLIIVCISILTYAYLISDIGTPKEIITFLDLINILLFAYRIIEKNTQGLQNLKGEIRLNKPLFIDMSVKMLINFEGRIYYTSYDTELEWFEVFGYKKNMLNILLYNKEKLNPQFSLWFSGKSKKVEEIILFLKDNCNAIE